jgi:5-formyltetrahydrofolate cyclo-ligase
LKVEQLTDKQIYRNSRNHLIVLDGKHVCYIDIPNEAVVYTLLEYVKTDDWELYVPAPVKTEVATQEEFETAIKEMGEETTDEIFDTKEDLKQQQRNRHYGKKR